MTVPTLADYQYQFKNPGGILLNGDTLPMWDVKKVVGLSFPTLNVNLNEYDGAHGGFLTAQYFDPRTIVVEGTLYANPTTVDANIRTLATTMLPSASDDRFWFKPSGIGTSYVLCKPIDVKVDVDTLRRVGACDFVLQFQAGDPRIYQDIAVANPTNNTQFFMNNLGHVASFPVFTLTGAITNLTLTVSGVGITFNGINATAGQVTVIDLGRRIVTKQGVNITSTYASGTWPSLVPGSTGWTFAISGGTPTIQVSARSAWML